MEDVREFLRRCELESYAENFEKKGYDSLPYLMSLSPQKLRWTAKKIRMPEGHIDRFVEGIKRQKTGGRKTGGPKHWGATSKTSGPKHLGASSSGRKVTGPKAPPLSTSQTTVTISGLPATLTTADEVAAATRSLSTKLGACTQIDRKNSGGDTKIFRCLNCVTENKQKLKHIRPKHRKCPFKVVWRLRRDKLSGGKSGILYHSNPMWSTCPFVVQVRVCDHFPPL